MGLAMGLAVGLVLGFRPGPQTGSRTHLRSAARWSFRWDSRTVSPTDLRWGSLALGLADGLADGLFNIRGERRRAETAGYMYWQAGKLGRGVDGRRDWGRWTARSKRCHQCLCSLHVSSLKKVYRETT